MVEAFADDERDPPEPVGGHGRLNGLHDRLESALGDRGHEATGAPALGDQRVRVGQGQGERLLHDHVLALAEGSQGDLRVGARRGADRNGVDILAGEELLEVRGPGHAPALAGGACSLGRGALHGDEDRAFDGRDRLDVLGRDRPGPDEREADNP